MCDQGGGKCLEAELTRRGFASDKKVTGGSLSNLILSVGTTVTRTKEDFRIRH